MMEYISLWYVYCYSFCHKSNTPRPLNCNTTICFCFKHINKITPSGLNNFFFKRKLDNTNSLSSQAFSLRSLKKPGCFQTWRIKNWINNFSPPAWKKGRKKKKLFEKLNVFKKEIQLLRKATSVNEEKIDASLNWFWLDYLLVENMGWKQNLYQKKKKI